MSFSRPLDRLLLSPRLKPLDERRPEWMALVWLVIAGTLFFNLGLAFLNTRVMGISQNHVVLCELALTGLALGLAMTRRASLYVVITLYITYMLMLMAIRAEMDLKSIRDALVPIIFYFVGRQIQDIRQVDLIVLWSAIAVLVVGLFEFLFLELYTANVNIFDYYVARGTITADTNFLGEDNALFHSGVRYGGRNFFGFLGNHRVSSVFLEPVSMGNFGAFLVLWGVFRRDMARRWLLLAIAFTLIILCDARFGMFVSLLFFAVAPFYRAAPRVLMLLAPVAIVVALMIYATAANRIGWDDTLTGRWLFSGQLLMKLDWRGILGISTNTTYLSDSGYAFALFQTGAIGLLALWALYVYAPINTDEAWKFKVLLVVYICLLMIVSYSLSTIKTGGLLWLCAGAVDAWRRGHDPAARSATPRSSPPVGGPARLAAAGTWQRLAGRDPGRRRVTARVGALPQPSASRYRSS
ncbi:UDP-phosphate alpha N-acetylglucosaminyltransferase [Pannonibacter tanglangensis]|uniref:UDP-phosphate alpha N-acetylglucosaminyltransferase n=1 Tax=Pannonibacter tanglangensis TaxID=2750084 RepID=UPI0015D2B449|nr:UDP-phosphate alpha N-acetylglucosaminyltransferase [Pannonibacter sp. XCT-53]